MRYIVLTLATFTLATFAQSTFAETPPQSPPALTSMSPSTVIVTVDDQAITAGQVKEELQRPDLRAAVDALQGQPDQLAKLEKSVLSSMIDKELLVKAAKKSPNYKPEEVKKELDSIIQEQGGQKVIQPILSSYGSSWDSFIGDMTARLTIEKFIERDLLQSIVISDKELKEAFSANPTMYAEPETVTARHILVLVKKDAPADIQKAAEKRIKEIRARVTAPGADFAAIAKETSDDTASKIEGGSLGAFQRGMMVPEFEQAAFALKVGEISEPVRTEYGYHIIKVEEHKKSEPANFETAKEKVKYRLMAQSHDKVITDKLAQLRGQAKIEYKLDGFKQS